MYDIKNNRLITVTSILLAGSILISSCSVGKKHKRFEDGYEMPSDIPAQYSVYDDGLVPDVELQTGGTCWANAACTVMENGYRKYGHRAVEMDAVALAVMVYNPHSAEGYMIADRSDIYEAGGTTEMVVDTAVNGFGSYVLVDSCDLTDHSEKDIKRGVMAFGGVTVGLNENEDNYLYTADTCSMIASDNDPINHQAVIVGWDDSFSKDEFIRPASRDGAWLVQNSYSAQWGDDGFYWVSYDTPITDLHTMVMSIGYSSVASYDRGFTSLLQYGTDIRVANAFTKTGRIGAVGTFTTAPGQHIVVEIMDSDRRTVLDSYEATFEIEGYHTIELDEPLTADSDGVFIAVTYSGYAPMEGPSHITNGIQYNASISAGQSYVYSNGSWLDLSEDSTLDVIGLSEACNNACIKALYL